MTSLFKIASLATIILAVVVASSEAAASLGGKPSFGGLSQLVNRFMADLQQRIKLLGGGSGFGDRESPYSSLIVFFQGIRQSVLKLFNSGSGSNPLDSLSGRR